MARPWIKVKVIRRRGRRGRPWVARWQADGRRWRQQNVPARYARSSESRERFRAALEDRLNGVAGAGGPGASTWTVQEAVGAFLAAKINKGLKPSAVRTYRHILSRFAGAPRPRALADVTGMDLERFLGQARLAPATRHKRWRTLKAFLRWCIRQGHLAANPLDPVEPPIVRDPTPFALDDRGVVRFLEALKARPTWSQAALRLAVLSGLRLGELADLDAAAINFAARIVRIPAAKSAEDRWASLDADTAGLLHELRHRERRLLWGPPDRPFVTRDAFDRALRAESRAVCSAARVPTPPKPVQGLRSTFATLAAAAGLSELALASTMGHRSIATTRKFYIAARKARAATEARDRVQRALDEARAGLGDPAGDQGPASICGEAVENDGSEFPNP